MRFGKCLTTMQIAEEIQAKNVLIITYKPEVFEGWLEIVNDHLDFCNWEGILAKKNPNLKAKHFSSEGKVPRIKQGKALVVCASLQDIQCKDDIQTVKRRIQPLFKKTWDLIIFDEVHYGGLTERLKITLNKIKHKKRIDLSGTPFRLLENVDLCTQQVFNYSYFDELKNKQNEEQKDPDGKSKKIYRAFPNLRVSTIEITKEDLNQSLSGFYNKYYEFSLNKLFSASKGKFVNEEAVDNFLTNLHETGQKARSVSVYGALSNKSRLNLPQKGILFGGLIALQQPKLSLKN